MIHILKQISIQFDASALTQAERDDGKKVSRRYA